MLFPCDPSYTRPVTAQLTPSNPDGPAAVPASTVPQVAVAASEVPGPRCPFSVTADPTEESRALEVAPPVDPREATQFLRQFHAELGLPGVEQRVAQVLVDLDRTGTYTHSAAELVFASQVAWRNAAKCVGRLPWSKLVVRDRRHVTSGSQIAEECVGHLRDAWNDGGILPTITVFPAAAPGTHGPRSWSPQLVRYAGHRTEGGRVVGDPSTLELTDRLKAAHGWTGAGTPFDVLPLVVQGAAESFPTVHPLPADAVQEVEISHPDHAAITDLGLRWHALPVIADQRLEAGGLWYTCAPFSGWYLADEVGARNFADQDRYDLLPEVARRLGLDTSRANPYWRDTAQLELTRAVHHSFKQARVTITDHHTEDKRMMTFARGARQRGHRLEVEWGWVAPPFGASLTRTWHELYDEPQPDETLRPAYVRQQAPRMDVPGGDGPSRLIAGPRDGRHDDD